MNASQTSTDTKTTPRTSKPRRRWLVWLRRMIIILIVIFLALIYVVFPLWASSLMTHASTRTIDRSLTKTPQDDQAEYKDVEFTASDGVRLSGWLLASRDKRATIIFSHGLFRS